MDLPVLYHIFHLGNPGFRKIPSPGAGLRRLGQWPTHLPRHEVLTGGVHGRAQHSAETSLDSSERERKSPRRRGGGDEGGGALGQGLASHRGDHVDEVARRRVAEG